MFNLKTQTIEKVASYAANHITGEEGDRHQRRGGNTNSETTHNYDTAPNWTEADDRFHNDDH